MKVPLLAWGAIDSARLLLGSVRTPSVVQPGGREGFEALKHQSRFNAMKMRRFDRITQLSIVLLEHVIKPMAELMEAVPRPEISLVLGTGLGTLETSLSCCDQIAAHGDKYCSPMGFMNSVHNSIGANIAQLFDIQGQNMTFSQTQRVFDIALLHAALLLQEQPQALVMVVGVEEMGAPLRGLLSCSPQAAPCYSDIEGDSCVLMVLGHQVASPYHIDLGSRQAWASAKGVLCAPEHPLASAQDLVDQLQAMEQGQRNVPKFLAQVKGSR